MDFKWVEAKRPSNTAIHGLDFDEVEWMFEAPLMTALDTHEDCGEAHWIGNDLSNGRALVAAFTERNDGRTIRIISQRIALSPEREGFEEILGHWLEEGGFPARFRHYSLLPRPNETEQLGAGNGPEGLLRDRVSTTPRGSPGQAEASCRIADSRPRVS